MITLTEKSFVQPTLSIYLGGSGIRVGESLLALRESLPADDRKLIEPFFIDSQEPAIADHERVRHYCYQNLGQFYEPTYQEFTKHRFPENLGETPVINSCEGCGVTRIFGTASLVACRDDFVNLVEQAVARLRRRRRESAQPLQVFLTASACGGTGAGMILDAAALVRHFFRTRVSESPRIFLFLIGPTVFFEDPSISLREDQRDRMRASTYALLKELHHFAQGHPFVSAYRLRDETVEIGNAADDDRLFEWVYFVDGRGEQAGATRSLAEVAWSISEAQLHLAVTEVGRKVAESMPNQREERVREYALHFVHPDNKDRLSAAGRERLKVSSRKTFLASLAVRNVRFPAADIKSWFRWGWVREALRKSLQREDSGDDRALIDQFDGLLGYDGRGVQPDGLLADLGLTPEQLLLRMREDADLDRGVPEVLSLSLNPDRAVEAADEALRLADGLVEDMKGDSSLLAGSVAREGGAAVSCEALLAQALPRWSASWEEGLAGDGGLAQRLWQLAWDPASGRGLRWLDALLVHTAQLLTDLARKAWRRSRPGDLEDLVSEARQRLRGLEKSRDRERSTLAFRGRTLLALAGFGSPYSEALRRKVKSVVRQLNELRQELLDRRSAHLAGALAPRAWLEAARQIRRWRDEVLVPTITAADNALTLAENRWQLARQALATQQGVNGRGPWQAHTTVQIADDELLASLAVRVADRVRVEDLVLASLREKGISRERHRLTVASFRHLDDKMLVEILLAHVDEATRGILAFLDNGWMLEEVGQRLRTSAAKALD
ncbi:MAG TPA: tubulin-like doman-containing protein, partial [Thermoanaerobaculia bacterium]|nr:tubulin-like doman-containing protein [Thermoanaerobaculia bacterium]